jgi:hypothetical protein
VRLITAHRILIGAAIAFFVFYAGRTLWAWRTGAGAGALVQAVVSIAVAVGLVVYYRTLRHWRGP